MVLLSILLLPFIAAILLLFVKTTKLANTIATFASLLTLGIAIMLLFTGATQLNASWLPLLNSRFILIADGLAKILILLTCISFPAVFIATSSNAIQHKNQFLSLLLFTQTGLLGVFLAGDALLFYFFWELALIPVYFLSSIWGGEKRIAVIFKFFIYTFLGSLFMLVGIILMNGYTADHSFLIASFQNVQLTPAKEMVIFLLFFIAFAIKMPIFPLHTWQPDAYEQAPTPVTMVLSAVMVKMGLYGVLRWLLPIFPDAVAAASMVIMVCSVVGVVYASFIAIRQDNLKRLIAYSSIAHIGLMSAALFSQKEVGVQGVMIQLFSHGINVLGLWMVADVIEQQTGTSSLDEMGGLAKKNPTLAILLVGFSFANIALPLTNAFVGEFLMFNGLFQSQIWLAVLAGVSIVLAAIYTLNMVQKVAYGAISDKMNAMHSPNRRAEGVLIVLLVLVFITGIYPTPLFELTADTLKQLFIK